MKQGLEPPRPMYASEMDGRRGGLHDMWLQDCHVTEDSAQGWSIIGIMVQREFWPQLGDLKVVDWQTDRM